MVAWSNLKMGREWKETAVQCSSDSCASNEGAKCELKLGCFLIRKVVACESCQDRRDEKGESS